MKTLHLIGAGAVLAAGSLALVVEIGSAPLNTPEPGAATAGATGGARGGVAAGPTGTMPAPPAGAAAAALARSAAGPRPLAPSAASVVDEAGSGEAPAVPGDTAMADAGSVGGADAAPVANLAANAVAPDGLQLLAYAPPAQASSDLALEAGFGRGSIGAVGTVGASGPAGQRGFGTADSVSGVPEPATWLGFIVGLGLIGASQRKRSGTRRVSN